MALAIGSKNERKNTKMDLITKLHTRMVEDTRGAGGRNAASPRSRRRRGDPDPDGPTEWEVYHDQVSWAKLKTERHKDLVLMSEDKDEVRVYYRSKGSQGAGVASNGGVNSGGGGGGPGDVKAKRQLTRCALDEEFSAGLTPAAIASRQGMQDPAPLEKAKDAWMKKDRVRTMLARRPSEMITTASTDNKPVKEDEMPLSMSKKEWNDVIRRTTEKEKGDKKAKVFVRKRVRHHRLTCKFHPYSTSSDFRKMSLAIEFPSSVMRQSLGRLLQASNGVSSGVSNPTPLDEYFQENSATAGEGGGEEGGSRRNSLPSPASPPAHGIHHHRTNSSRGGGGGGSEHSEHHLLNSSTTTSIHDDARTANMMMGDHRVTSETSTPIGGDFFITQPQSVGDRCRTPNLTRFTLPAKPHAVPGEFQDCSCTPRSSDDEMGEDEGYNQRLAQMSAEQRKRTEESRSLGSSQRADRKVSLWKRRFQLVNVRGLATLHSVLDEREDQRAYAVTDRSQLNIVTQGAEEAGADWIISRRLRCTTPKNSSVWNKVNDALGDQDKLVAKNRETYVQLCEKASQEYNLPSHDVEITFFEALRRRCLQASMLPEDTDYSSDFFKILNKHSKFKSIKGRVDHKPSKKPPTKPNNQLQYGFGSGGLGTSRGGGSAARGAQAGGLPPRPTSQASNRPPSRLTPLLGVTGGGTRARSTTPGGLGSASRASTPGVGGGGVSQSISMERADTDPEVEEENRLFIESAPHCAMLLRSPDGQPLTGDFFWACVHDFCYHFTSSRNGIFFMNYLRELCCVDYKPFFQLVAEKGESGEWAVHHEAGMLAKRLQASRTGLPVDQDE